MHDIYTKRHAPRCTRLHEVAQADFVGDGPGGHKQDCNPGHDPEQRPDAHPAACGSEG